MSIPIYQVDAFTEKPFSGNPAGVCVLPQPADEAWMQSVAMEMNLSETAFVVRQEDGAFGLRWFTPTVEVALCGHGTLATSHILYETGILKSDEVARFHTKSGLLQARQVNGLIELDFPSTPAEDCDTPDELLDALGLTSALYIGQPRFDYLIEVQSEAELRSLTPDFGRLRSLDIRGVMVTAKSDRAEFDFVSRFFGPGSGIDEDPVTGSAHCALAPYWAKKLGKNKLTAYQASTRGGKLLCTLVGDRVKLAGRALTVLAGELTV
jgi:PhzF family phenazine biosynthesis protein